MGYSLIFKISRKTLQHENEAHKIVLSEIRTISGFFHGKLEKVIEYIVIDNFCSVYLKMCFSHRVNGIAVQFGHHLRPLEPTPYIAKSKKRSVNVILDKELLVFRDRGYCEEKGSAVDSCAPS